MKELYPNIKAFQAHWRDAPMVQDGFRAFEACLEKGFDGTVCASRAIVECACKTIVAELEDPENPLRKQANSPINNSKPSLSNWMAATTQLLNLTDGQKDPFNSMIGQYNQLAEKLGKFRNTTGNISHGRMGFARKLSEHHRRSAVLIADTIVGFLHDSYLEQGINPVSSFEPYERFDRINSKIDAVCAFESARVEDDGTLKVSVLIGPHEKIDLSANVSRFLFGVDRQSYREAQLATVDNAGGSND